jgi:hypothetical protein
MKRTKRSVLLLCATGSALTHVFSLFNQRTLQARVEELRAYLDRLKQQEGPDSATNMEYLKNCVFKFMSSTDLSEKRRLYPVIATILKLTSQEMKAVESAFQLSAAQDNELQNTLSSLGSFATNSLGSFWDVLGTGGSTGPSTGGSGGGSRPRPS